VEPARVAAYGSLDGERMAKKSFALRMRGEGLPGALARHVHRAGYDSPLRTAKPPDRVDTSITEPLVSDAVTESFVIEGGRPLNGVVRAAGNKNAALPIVAACLLTEEPVLLTNVPAIRDVETMLELVADIGVEVEHLESGGVLIRAGREPRRELDEELCRRIRASILLAGPLLARVGEAIVPPPGGDVIGRRRLDVHIDALQRLGAEVHVNRRFHMRTDGLAGAPVFLDEASVTGTENTVMAAVLARGETIVGNAACEPHVQDLCRFLVSLGAEIEGIGSNVLRIRGVDRLRGGEWRVCPDHIEVASFIGLGAVTEGRIVIEDVHPEDLVAIWPAFERLGVAWDVADSSISVPADQELTIQDDVRSQIPKIEDGPWPAFPADLTSIALAVATQARGTVLIFEKMFENRLFFVDKLVNMGARIILCDPHRAVVTGPAKLYGERMESPDIRAGMAMLIASLCAEGTSTIGNIGQIDRGYERIDERLRALGASVERVEA
jgi:UDP-N-acetylglucosamine 1-carboxyvinyltransferase